MPVTADTVIRRNTEILYAPVGPDEAVMMSVSEGKYFGLNAVAIRVWELLQEPTTPAKIVATLCDEFDVDADICRSEVLRFVDELIDSGIVRVAAA
jgi:hypothetical protein